MGKIKIIFFIILAFIIYKGVVAFKNFEIGVSDRVTEIEELADFEKEGECIHVFINGKIIDTSGESWFEEGCLSIPDVRLNVKRPETIKFRFEDLSRKEHIEEFEGLMARAIQHEMDHLNGIFIVDRVSQTEKMSVNKSLKDIEKSAIKKSKIRRDFVL